MSEKGVRERIQSRAQARGNPSFVWRAGQERRLDLVRRQASLQGARVLDAGCGTGMYVAAFQRHGASAWGVEIEADRAGEALKVTPNVALASVERLPFARGAFDLVFSHEVIEHVEDDARAIREAARVLRAGGRLALFAPNRWYPFETHGVVWRGTYHFGNYPLVNYLPARWRDRLCPHARAYTRRAIRRLFEGAPLRIVLRQRGSALAAAGPAPAPGLPPFGTHAAARLRTLPFHRGRAGGVTDSRP